MEETEGRHSQEARALAAPQVAQGRLRALPPEDRPVSGFLLDSRADLRRQGGGYSFGFGRSRFGAVLIACSAQRSSYPYIDRRMSRPERADPTPRNDPQVLRSCKAAEGSKHNHHGVAGTPRSQRPASHFAGGCPASVGIRELAAALALNTTLTCLTLPSKELGDADAHELAGMLERNTTLKELSLHDNNIGADGARHLAAALERNKMLEELSLRNNHIGADGARHAGAEQAA